jgi:predicted transport protein
MATKTSDAATQTMITNLPGKTGKSLDAWLRLLGNQSLEKHGEIVKWLKTEHGVTHGFANLIAHSYRDARSGGPTIDLVEAQYQGAKADLRPIYDALIKMVKTFGTDVEIAPKKTYVSLRRNKQFGLVMPSTRDRIDVGINLKDEPETERLEVSGSFNSMVSHRVRLTNRKDVNAQLKRWLRKAYDAA